MSVGINLGAMFNTVTDSLNKSSSAIQARMESLQTKDGSVDPAELMRINFEVGQYNAKMESISSFMKSMQDLLKSLAQRTG